MPRKYHNEPVDGFDSRGEMRRYQELALLEKAGEITNLRKQRRIALMGPNQRVLKYPSGRPAEYVADFSYRNKAGELVIEDFKGHPTTTYKLKRAIVEAMGYRFIETKAPKQRASRGKRQRYTEEQWRGTVADA